MTYPFIKADGGKRLSKKQQKNDCTVVAMSNAFAWGLRDPYGWYLSLLWEYGRKDNEGFELPRVLKARYGINGKRHIALVKPMPLHKFLKLRSKSPVGILFTYAHCSAYKWGKLIHPRRLPANTLVYSFFD